MTPQHPAVVHFPIALTIVSVVADATAWVMRGSAAAPSLFATGWWTLVGAVALGAVAIVLGLSDMRRQKIPEEAHRRVHYHMRIGFTVFVVLGVLFVWRLVQIIGGQFSVGPAYLSLAIVALALIVYQGWLGGELVFRYGVGVTPTGHAGRANAAIPSASHREHAG
jgi:uncharacterized membrane protein